MGNTTLPDRRTLILFVRCAVLGILRIFSLVFANLRRFLNILFYDIFLQKKYKCENYLKIELMPRCFWFIRTFCSNESTNRKRPNGAFCFENQSLMLFSLNIHTNRKLAPSYTVYLLLESNYWFGKL